MTATTTTATTTGIEVGDCFQCSWGYDQTNVDFYRVDRVTAKSIELVAIGAILVSTNEGGDRLAPDPHTEVAAWRAPFGGGRNRKLCKVTVDSNGEPYAILKAGSSWSCTYTARPVRGFAYDNSRIGR